MTKEEALEKIKLESEKPLQYNIHYTEANELIDKIYDDFESRICENCIHCINRKEIVICCHGDNIQEIHNFDMMQITLDFGCNKFERKQNV